MPNTRLPTSDFSVLARSRTLSLTCRCRVDESLLSRYHQCRCRCCCCCMGICICTGIGKRAAFFLYLLTLISFLFIQMSAAASCILAFSVCVCVYVYLCAVWIVTVCLRDSVGFFRCFLSFHFIPLRCFILHAASLYFIFYNVATITHTHTYTHKHIGREYMFAISLLLLSPTRAVKGIRHTHTHRSAVKG